MKTIEEIKKTPHLLIIRTGVDGGMAQAYLSSTKRNRPAMVVFSNGGGWDHVSVSFSNRCPTWDEMCEIKKLFFYPEEVAWEYHPMESEYVNQHPYCLHIWRYQQPGMVMPPAWMVGVKDGQSFAEVLREATAALGAAESAGKPATGAPDNFIGEEPVERSALREAT